MASLSTIKADGNTPSGLTPEMLLPQFNKMSPEAASLGRYGAFQVSEYSGAVNISIPLYTVKSGDVSFPINLYYDATGIKVEQDATMVGLGWNLSYGGMISHIVCGEDDFREYPGFSFRQDWWKEQKENLKYKYQELPFWLEPRATVNGFVLGWDEITFGYIDLEREGRIVSDLRTTLFAGMSKGNDVPDVFQANFCGHNISFAIDKRTGGSNGQYPIIVLNNNSRKYNISYKTEASIAPYGSSGYPTSFVIIDDKGITYCFSGYSEVYYKNIDSYYLTKIYGPDGEKGKSRVEFKNEKIRISLGNSRTLTKCHKPTAKRIFNQMDKDVNENTFNSLYYNLAVNPPSYNVDVACGEGGKYYTVYPKKIITALDTIEFIKGKRLDINDENAKCISGIKIKSITGNAQRKISFTYDNFFETPAKEYHRNMFTHKRLKLTSVKIDDQKYKFEYDDSIKLPSFASYSKDYWGYYNGANPDATCFVGCSPAYAISDEKVVPVEHYLEGSNRLASEKLCKVGMLKKITYPTGGYTLYEFEANRFNDKYYYPDASYKNPITPKNENGGYSIGGGVRVKTIKNYDSDGTYLNGVKYEYSGGKLLSPTVQLEKHYIDCYNVRDRIIFSFNYVNTEPSYLYICSLGIPAVVGYDKVVKKEVDESGKKIYRKTVLDFYNYGYITDDPATEAINSRMQNTFFFNSYYDNNVDHAKGHLNGMVKRDSVFNGSVLSSTTKYEYKYTKLDTIYYQKCLPTHLPNIDNVENASLAYDLAFYRKVITWNYLTSKTETLYDSNGKQTTSNTTSFQYNKSNYQLSDLSVTDGTNTSRTHYYYPSDKKVTGYQYLNDAHKISELTAIDTYRNGNYAGGSMFNYCKWKNTNLPVVNECYSITPSKAKILEMKVDPTNGYDNYGNIRQYTKKDGTDVTIIWSYNHQLPIMEIVGSTYTEVCNKAKNVKNISSLENASFVSETTMSSIHATLRKDLPNALVTAYTYSPWHSVSQIIKPNGEKTVYSYDGYGRLQTVLDANLSNFRPLQMYNYNYKK